MIRSLKRLRRDRRGATLIEFAWMALPTMTIIMGLFDMTYTFYVRAILEGAVQKAARDSTLETGASAAAGAAIDARVKNAVKDANTAVTDSSFTFTRKNFADFTQAGKMEPATGPGGLCAPSATYIDINGNSDWDDGAIAGQGGAKDAVVYTAEVRFNSLFPVQSLYGADAVHVVRATTILRNQPYKSQNVNSGVTRNCP